MNFKKVRTPKNIELSDSNKFSDTLQSLQLILAKNHFVVAYYLIDLFNCQVRTMRETKYLQVFYAMLDVWERSNCEGKHRDDKRRLTSAEKPVKSPMCINNELRHRP